MIISDLNHLETVAESQGVIGGWTFAFSVFNKADVDQKALAYAYSGKATANKGNADASASAYATNYSVIDQSNKVTDIAIDP